MDATSVATGAGTIFGIIGGLKTAVPGIPSLALWVLSVVLGVVFGYFGLFGFDGGIAGVQQGIVAAMSISTVNTFVNKVSGNTPPPTKV